jgi:hypothetical protein
LYPGRTPEFAQVCNKDKVVVNVNNVIISLRGKSCGPALHLNNSMGESKICVGEARSPMKKLNSPVGEVNALMGELNSPLGEQNYGAGEVDLFTEELN